MDWRQPVKSQTDSNGRFQLEWAGAYQFGHIATVHIETATGLHYEVNVLVSNGVVEVRVPMLVDATVRGPADVGVGELAGVVVDDLGRPIADVDVGHRTKTDKQGVFRVRGFNPDEKVKVQFRKPGYSPETFSR